MATEGRGVMATDDQGFKVRVQDDFVHLETWGKLHSDGLDEPAKAAIALAQQAHLTKLLDNIQNVEPESASVMVQAKGMGVLWKLKVFDKVAIVFKGQEMGWLFLSSMQALHLNMSAKFKGFDNETEAIIWLQES
jgi:hypothetical protein